MSKSLFVYRKNTSFFKRLIFVFTAVVLAMGWLTPLMNHNASAAQITQRSLQLSTAQPSASATYTFTFTTATSAFHLDGIKLIACTTAVGSYPGGTCTAPTGFSFASATYGSISGFTDTTAFTIDAAGANDCIATSHPEVLCLKRTSSSNDTAGAKTLVINAVTNPSTINTAFYVGITTYNANTWPVAGRKDAGTTASAIVQSLQINAQVAEFLNFCIGNTAVDDSTTNPVPGGNHDCTQISGTSINIGVLSSGSVNVSPVASTNGGDSNNGIAMVRSNAGNGIGIYYRAIQALTGTNHLGSLRISGASCNAGNVNSDGCINSIGTTQQVITAGTEDFGMTIAGVNHGDTNAYSCVYDNTSGDTCDLVPQNQYVGQGTFGTPSSYRFCNLDTCNTAGNGFAWDETGTSELIASSASSTIKQVDDEALILKFGATSSIITPFGQYSVQADFIAVPTY